MARLRNITTIEGDAGELFPVGTLVGWGNDTIPAGFLKCDGSLISRTTYAKLFSEIGTNFGAGDGSTTFALPDARQRFLIGKSDSGTANFVGAVGGEIDHDHTVPGHYHEMSVANGSTLNITSSGNHTTSISHNHGAFTSGGSGTLSTNSDSHSHTVSGSTSSTGDHAHFLNATNNNWSKSSSTTNTLARAQGGDGADMFTGFPGYTGADLDGAHSHNISGSTNSDSHSHTIASHTHSIDVPNFSANSSSDGSHTHSASNFSGSIGNVSGGVNGNNAIDTDDKNPPFLTINWIIKAE